MKRIASRVVQLIPTTFGALVLVFFLMRVLPGDPAAAMLGTNATPQAGGTGARAPLDQTQLLAWLKTHGLARDPTAEECRVAAEWEALSEADKQAHLAFMHRLILDPPLSQLLIAQRH